MTKKPAMLLAVAILVSSANAASAADWWRLLNRTPTPISGSGSGIPTRTATATPSPTATPAPNVPPDAFQVRYASNLNIGDSVVNITNAGSNSGNICANVYVFAPDEQLIACCGCVVTPNALVSLSAINDLISNTLTPAVPNSITIKLLATGGTPCNPAFPMTATLAPGMRAWGTTLHALPVAGTYGVTETEFSPAVLSASELADLTSSCGFIQSDGSGFGICRSCRLGGQ